MRISINKNDMVPVKVHEDTFCYEIFFDFQSENDSDDGTCEVLVRPWNYTTPSLEEIKHDIMAFYENNLAYKLASYSYNNKVAFLDDTVLNSIRFEYLIAKQDNGSNLPYHFILRSQDLAQEILTFNTVEELSNFYQEVNNFVKEAKLECWNKENAVDYQAILQCLDEIPNPDIQKIELESARQEKLNNLNLYDTSGNVNCFFINDYPAWLSKADRVGLSNSTNILLNLGIQTSSLWLNNMEITINCETLLQMLALLEIYALECYAVTERHKCEISSLETIEEIQEYDITTGYPLALSFTL